MTDNITWITPTNEAVEEMLAKADSRSEDMPVFTANLEVGYCHPDSPAWDEYCDTQIDAECRALVRAINRIPGLVTTWSCCGHGKQDFAIGIKLNDSRHLPILLYYIDGCHIGFYGWTCLCRTDCGMSPASYSIHSGTAGQQAYMQAAEIADAINDFMDRYPEGLEPELWED